MDWSSDVCSAELAAHEDHAFAGIVDAVPVTGVRDVAVVADDLPARAEDALHLDRVEIGVAVGPRGKRPAVQRISGERVDGVESRSEEHTSELQSLMRISYAVFCLKKQKQHKRTKSTKQHN